MTELKKNEAPTLFNDKYVTAPLNTLKRTKNDFIDRKTVWHIAIFSFLLGTLISLFLLWFSTKQAFDSSTVPSKNSAQQSNHAEIGAPQRRLSNNSANNQIGINDLANNNSIAPAGPKGADIQNELTTPVTDIDTTENNSEALTNNDSKSKPDHYLNSDLENQPNTATNKPLKSQLKVNVVDPVTNKTTKKATKKAAAAKPETTLKTIDKPKALNQDKVKKQDKSSSSSAYAKNTTDKPKVDVIEQWINTHLKTQADHNPFRVLQQDSSNTQVADKKNAKAKNKKNAD